MMRLRGSAISRIPSGGFPLFQPEPSCPGLLPLLELHYVLGDARLLRLELALACRRRPGDSSAPFVLELPCRRCRLGALGLSRFEDGWPGRPGFLSARTALVRPTSPARRQPLRHRGRQQPGLADQRPWRNPQPRRIAPRPPQPPARDLAKDTGGEL